uniref:Reverse transcriptase domain-containing protein n=1 Tax=Lactuca sativa TaxID=4236 RepID=A0A9R1WGX2_LACSA|nr:hypothetical protein LSAT_V11C200063020 [Lactuca sativa]
MRGSKEEKMAVDDIVKQNENARNKNGGLLITEGMLDKVSYGNSQEKTDMPWHMPKDVEDKVGEKISYAEKVSGKKLNAANLISVIKMDPNLPVGVVEMPYSDILKGCSPFKTTLYGYFIDKHVNFFNVNKFAHNMWKKHGLEEVMGMISVLKGGVWMIFDSALVVRRWTTGVSSAKGQHDKVPVWVKIFNVPLEYWNGTGLSHIAWEIGKPLDVNAHTANMCQNHWGRPAFMRILIEMSASKDWLKEVQVYSSDLTTGERILTKCRVEYAWNPSKCSHCKVYGHKDSNCGILLANQVNEIINNSKKEENSEGVKIDLMQVLIDSTKKVESDEEGFQTVGKKNNGKNAGEKPKAESGKKNQNFGQGQNGKMQRNGRDWIGSNYGNQGQNGNKQGKVGEASQQEELRKKVVSGQRYIPKLGPDIKISSNFELNPRSVKEIDVGNIFSKNKFDILENLEDENPFIFAKGGVNEDDLAYLDSVDHMEIPTWNFFPMMFSFGIWNIRGLNLSPKQKEIKNLIKENNLSLLAVLESQVSASKLHEKCDKIFGSWKWVASKGIYGNTIRIIVGWNSNFFDVNLIDQNDQVLHCKISFPTNNKFVFCSFVYAANKYMERRVLWSSLKMFKGVVRDDPWIIGGDFNVTLNLNESTAGSSRLSIGMEDFLDCINSLDIQDINCNGLNYTWNQKPRGKNGILKKPDRVMGNCRIIEEFPSIYASFLPYGISDHSPMVIKIPLKMKFNVLPLVEAQWNYDVKGNKMFCLVQKLKALKKPIRKLFRDQGHLTEKVSHYRKELAVVQADFDKDPFNPKLRDLEAIFLNEFKKAYAEEECFLKQKAKVGWLKEGDSNSKFFHKIVKGRNNRNNIRAVLNEQGEWIEDEKVPNIFINYFKEFLGTENHCAEIDNPHSLFSKKLDLVYAAEMVKVVTDEEIKSALFDINDDKAPGPDGFSAKFFKSMWAVIGNDFCQAVKEFFCNGKLLKEVNATVIALVPKIDTPGKCISKIIVGRIRNYLNFIVSNNQSAFIPGRSITDNILLSQELVRGYHRDRGFSRCAMKVDIQKAYDTVNWSFLQDILFFFGFHPVMIKWIMCCVTTPTFMLSINGSFYGYFEGKRGLRQGCPLSPYLFTLVMETFNLILQRKIRNEKFFKNHWGCKKQKITHLCFADDLMIFCHGNKASVKVIKEALDEFAGVAGLNPNLAKSHIFFGNVKANMKKKILDSLAFVEGKLPMRYLGLPLISTRLFIRDCKRLITAHFFSSFSFPMYWASSMLIPMSVIKEIEKMMKNFLWNHDESKKGRAKMAWSAICKPVANGGLGLRSLRMWNKAILSKRIWMILSDVDSLWEEAFGMLRKRMVLVGAGGI